MALFLFVASALAAADATAHFGMTLPLYQQPSADWKRVAKSAVDNPSVNIGVILAPYNGIPDVPNAGDDIEKYVAHNQTWLDYMDMLRNGGVSIMHYLHMRNLTCGVENECDTCEGTAGKFCCLTPDGICVDVMRCCNSIENVTSIVNASTTYFPQDGIFTDNGPYAKPYADSSVAQTMADLHNYEAAVYSITQLRAGMGGFANRPVESNGAGNAMTAHETWIDTWALENTNETIMTEGIFTTETIPMLPDFARKYPSWRFSVLAWNCTTRDEMLQLVDAFVDAGYGKICIINDASYAKVPDYWEEEVAYLASKKPKVWSAVAA